jgi:hypothetical protein
MEELRKRRQKHVQNLLGDRTSYKDEIRRREKGCDGETILYDVWQKAAAPDVLKERSSRIQSVKPWKLRLASEVLGGHESIPKMYLCLLTYLSMSQTQRARQTTQAIP